jgi:multidrug efflux pump subunit AcrB
MRQHSKISLSTWAIRHPIPVLVLFLVLTTVGIAAFFNIPVNYMPSVVVPVVTIKINQPGATAVEIDNQITKKIEAAITGIQGVKHVESHVSEGVSLSTLNFYLETSFEQAVNDTREAVANIKDQLPK